MRMIFQDGYDDITLRELQGCWQSSLTSILFRQEHKR